MQDEIEAIVRRVPQWKDAPHIKIEFLGGGITNKNYRVEVAGQICVLRVPGKNTELLGISREVEYAASEAAAEQGVGPRVVYFLRPEGYLVTEFVPGRPMEEAEIRRPENIRQVVEALKKIHTMHAIPGTFSPFRIVESYAEIAARHNVPFPQNFDWLLARKDEIERAFLTEPFTPSPCHNDLLIGNFLWQEGKICILDWEYAGMGDIFFDLANFAINHNFNDQEDRLLLEAYFGQADGRRYARLKLMKMMSDFRESMWGLVQAGISSLDFDFLAYAEKHFQRMTRNMEDPRFAQWIKEVQQNA